MADYSKNLIPLCPKCEGRMTLASTAKRAFIVAELRKFECRRCEIMATAEEVAWESPEAAHEH
jgi:hypothetical protein